MRHSSIHRHRPTSKPGPSGPRSTIRTSRWRWLLPRSHASTRLGYQVGVRINLDVLNATTLLFTTQRDLKKSRYDFLVNGMRLKSTVGSLDDKDVESINALLTR